MKFTSNRKKYKAAKMLLKLKIKALYLRKESNRLKEKLPYSYNSKFRQGLRLFKKWGRAYHHMYNL